MSDHESSILGELATAAPPEDAAAAAARRERVVGSIERAIAREAGAARQKARRARVYGGLAIAAAIALGAGVAWRMRARPAPPVARVAPTVTAPLATAPAPVPEIRVESALAAFRGAGELHRGDLVHPGDAVTTSAGGLAALDLPSGDRVTVTGEARVMIDFLVGVETVSVERGTASVESAGALHVRAGNVDVTMRDAAKLTLHAGASVSILVTEGTIDVKHDGLDDVVRAPGKWPSSRPAASAIEGAPKKHDASSTLGEQNALLQSAQAARRRGDDDAAIRSLDELLARYPRSPLAQDAHVERMRAYERSGRHADAVAEAGRYLADFPAGYARDEAKAIVVK